MIQGSEQRPRHWWDGRWALLILSFTGLAIKLLVVGHAINPGPYPPSRAPGLTTIGVLALCAVPFIYVPARARSWSVLAFNAIGTAVALVDVWCFRFYRDVPSLNDIGRLWQVQLAAASLPALVRPVDLAAAADIVGLGLCMRVSHRDAMMPRLFARVMASIVLISIAILAVQPVLRIASHDPDEVFEYAFERQEVVGAAGLAGYHVYDLVRNVWSPFRGRLAVTAEDTHRVAQILQSRDAERFASRLAGSARGQNVIALSAESLQAFVMGLSVGGQEITPNLNAFARESLQFTRFYDQTHRGTTADAEFISLNSLLPLPFGTVATRYASNHFRALPDVLKERGYRTLSACAEPPAYWNMGDMHPKLGFARSLFAPEFPGARWVGAGLDDASFFDRVTLTLEAEAKPFFAYLISSSNHHPYRLPSDLRRLQSELLPEGIAGDYLQSVRYFDEAFGRFVLNLAQDGLLDRTLIVVFGDHQANLDDAALQRLWHAAGHEKDASPLELWRFRSRVPLLIRFPRATVAGSKETPGGHLDITPTVLSLVGIDDMSGPWLGRDLTAPARNLVVFRDGSLTDEAVTMIHRNSANPKCYVRDGEAIPCESIASLRAESRTLFEVSDTIITGNLARSVTTQLVAGPRMSPHALGPVLVIAHRGDSIHYPENTLASIRAAFDLGADAVEVDVRLSRDGVPMIFHDDTLDRTTDGRGAFERLSMRELRSLDAGGWFDPRFAGARIPTLEEVLRIARGRGSLLLDLKVDGLAAPVRSVFERVGADPASAIVGGWTPAQRSEFVRDMPRSRILITENAPVVWDAGLFADVRRRGLWGFELGDDWPPPFIADARLRGFLVIAYTVNDEPTLSRLVEAGVSGIETDDPGLLLRVAARFHAR